MAVDDENSNKVSEQENIKQSAEEETPQQIKHKYEISIEHKIMENEEIDESSQKVNITTIIHSELESLQELNEMREEFEKFYKEKLSAVSCPIELRNYFTVLDQFYKEQRYFVKNSEEFENEWLNFLRNQVDNEILFEDQGFFISNYFSLIFT